MQNIDASEIANFDQHGADWWNPEGVFKTLHQINGLRLQFIQNHTLLAGKKVIDIGCGGGILAESIASKGAIVTAVDMSPAAIAAAKAHQTPELNIDYRLDTAENLALAQPQQFDVVTCMELLEHVPDPAFLIASCAQLVKPNGQLFFSTLNRNLKSYLYAVLGAEYIFKLLPKGTHHYGSFIRPSELNNCLRSNDLALIDLKGFSYQPFTGQCRFTTDVSVNYLVACQPC